MTCLFTAIEIMGLASEYKKQFEWRDWPTVFDALPPLDGQTVLDLGCGVGDLSAEFVTRGARVIGVDMNEELLREARSRQLRTAEFRTADLRTLPALGLLADGIWCSFAAAYFPDLPTVLGTWARSLKPGGWIALTEIDDLFGHEPLSVRTKALFRAHAERALAAGYDVHMGQKLRAHLEQSGFHVTKMLTLDDKELSFDGPARPDVLDGWRARFERMALLREICGPEIDQVQAEVLACLQRADHISIAKVRCCIAIREHF